jgi:hypothetical protein
MTTVTQETCEVCGADSSKGVCYGCAVVWNTLNEIALVNPEALDNFIKTKSEVVTKADRLAEAAKELLDSTGGSYAPQDPADHVISALAAYRKDSFIKTKTRKEADNG